MKINTGYNREKRFQIRNEQIKARSETKHNYVAKHKTIDFGWSV